MMSLHGGELLLLHLGGHLTPNAGQTEGGAQTVGAEVPLKQAEWATLTNVSLAAANYNQTSVSAPPRGPTLMP